MIVTLRASRDSKEEREWCYQLRNVGRDAKGKKKTYFFWDVISPDILKEEDEGRIKERLAASTRVET